MRGAFARIFRPALQGDFLVLCLIFKRKGKNKMKTSIYKILTLILALAMAISLVCCDKESEESGSMTLVVAGDETQEFTVELSELEITEGLVSVLDYLKSEGKLDYAITGGYLDSVGGLANNALTGEYIYIYTSVAADMDVSQYATTVEYEGQSLTSSGVGANEMHIEDGCVIYIGYITWG